MDNTITVGEMVLYYAVVSDRPELNNNRKGLLPAIVTEVHSPDVVNLQVFANSAHGSFWLTSIVKGDEPGNWNYDFGWVD